MLPGSLLHAAEPKQRAALDEAAFYPEGPTIWRDSLYWAEMTTHRIRRHAQGKTDTVWELRGCGPTSIKRDAERGFWILCHLAHLVIRVDNAFQETGRYDRDEKGGAIAWPNDASSDAAGRLYLSSAGVFDLGAPATGRVLLIDGDRPVRVLVTGLRYANGVYLDRAKQRLYVSEHLARKVHVLQLAGPDQVRERRVFFDFDAAGIDRPAFSMAGPDGLRIIGTDLYVAEYGGGRIHVVTPEGKLRRTIRVPLPLVTNMEYWPSRGFLAVVGAYEGRSPLQDGRVLSIDK
jgi:sugar lactone lactonase YvrE